MAKTTAPTMRQMPPVRRLRAASTAGPTRGPAAPASTVMVPSLLRCYLLSHLLARLPLSTQSDRCSCRGRRTSARWTSRHAQGDRLTKHLDARVRTARRLPRSIRDTVPSSELATHTAPAATATPAAAADTDWQAGVAK